jgi:hypothetical protein
MYVLHYILKAWVISLPVFRIKIHIWQFVRLCLTNGILRFINTTKERDIMNASSVQRSSGFFSGLLKAVFVFALILPFAGCGSVGQLDSPESAKYNVGGNVTNLTGSGLVLQNVYGNDLSVSENGAFTFSGKLVSGSTYGISVLTQPSGQTCAVINESGQIANADVTDVIVNCNGHSIGGTVSGLTGSGLVLSINGGYYLDIPADGSFTFSKALLDGDTYTIGIRVQPTSPSQTCVITNGSGTISGANVTNIVVNCP